MVSPPYKQSSNAATAGVGGNEIGVPVAPDGNAAGFTSEGLFAGAETYLGGQVTVNDYVSRRSASGWVTSTALPPASLLGGPSVQDGLGSDFSPDLRSKQLSCGASGPNGNSLRIPDGVACVLRQQEGGEWTTPQLFRTVGNTSKIGLEGIYLGASADLSRGFFQADARFLPADLEVSGNLGIYEISGIGGAEPEHLRLVNVSGGFESEKVLPLGGLSTGAPPEGPLFGDFRVSVKSNGTAYHAISEDGQTVFFSASPPATKAPGEPAAVHTLFARVDGSTPGAHTVDVAFPSPGCTATECTEAKACTAHEREEEETEGGENKDCLKEAIFQGASADGSRSSSRRRGACSTKTKTPLGEKDGTSTSTTSTSRRAKT